MPPPIGYLSTFPPSGEAARRSASLAAPGFLPLPPAGPPEAIRRTRRRKDRLRPRAGDTRSNTSAHQERSTERAFFPHARDNRPNVWPPSAEAADRRRRQRQARSFKYSSMALAGMMIRLGVGRTILNFPEAISVRTPSLQIPIILETS